ncbi:unnamed protein product [Arctia plantaginis]|uniref:Uncharacterized protein n=1 Tax=Arctia plantaginis TaxID=874455 RepID=A0A8S1AEB5_ARCPL|nr:unnamed protein product [Arctia plantaginis]
MSKTCYRRSSRHRHYIMQLISIISIDRTVYRRCSHSEISASYFFNIRPVFCASELLDLIYLNRNTW